MHAILFRKDSFFSSAFKTDVDCAFEVNEQHLIFGVVKIIQNNLMIIIAPIRSSFYRVHYDIYYIGSVTLKRGKPIGIFRRKKKINTIEC